MTQAMTRYETAPPAPIVTDEHIRLIKNTVAKDATDAELNLYLYDCQRHGVHPLDRLLHFTKRAGKYTPITSIDLLRSRAADTGDLAGIDDARYGGEVMKPDFTATVTVYRIVQSQRCPFSATARWSEYKPEKDDFMWRKMPYLMLAKCAEALALRKAFPRQLAGLYAQEEMDQAGGGASYSAPQALPPAPPANKTTGEVVEAQPAGDDGLKELKALIATARQAKIQIPPSACKSLSRMSAEEIRTAVLDLQMAIERALPPPEDHSELLNELDKAGL